MADNIHIGPDAQINHTIAVLRDTVAEGPLAARTELVPGIFLAVDPKSDVSGTYRTGNGDVLSLEYRVNTKPDWLALHLVWNGLVLESHVALGIAARSRAVRATTFRPCLRSGTESGFIDCFFDKHVVAYQDDSLHVDMVKLKDRTEQIPAQAPWRELILFFRPADATLTLHDLRIFVV